MSDSSITKRPSSIISSRRNFDSRGFFLDVNSLNSFRDKYSLCVSIYILTFPIRLSKE